MHPQHPDPAADAPRIRLVAPGEPAARAGGAPDDEHALLRSWPGVESATGVASRGALRRMRELGAWLRHLHDDDAPGPRRDPGAVAAVLGALETWPTHGRGDAAHRASLARWAAALARRPAPGGSLDGLTLARLRWSEDGVAVVAPAEAVAAPAALDVGWLTGDLVALTHRVRAAGEDPGALEGLLAAFLTGYDGLTAGGRGRSLEVRRAAATRLLVRAVEHAGTPEGELDLGLCRLLVERCWAEERAAS